MNRHVVALYVLVILGQCAPRAQALGPDLDRLTRALERIASACETLARGHR